MPGTTLPRLFAKLNAARIGLLLASLTWALALPSVALHAQAPPNPPTIAGDAHDWPMYNRDVLGMRFNFAEKSLGPKNVGELIEKWRFPARDSSDKIGHVHTVVTVKGCVYFGTVSMPAFYKLGPDGKQKWVYRDVDLPQRVSAVSKASHPLPPAGFLNSSLITLDTVYVGDAGGYIYALDEATGKERWKIDTRNKPFPGAHTSNCVFSSPILAEGNIVLGGGAYEHLVAADPKNRGCTGRGFVVALEPRTGKVVWKYDVGPEPKEFDKPVTIRRFHGFLLGQAGFLGNRCGLVDQRAACSCGSPPAPWPLPWLPLPTGPCPRDWPAGSAPAGS